MSTAICLSSVPPVCRAEIVRRAREWVGTPYHHQASVKSVGADCLGLVRGVWREIYGTETETPPAYSRDWAEASGIEALLASASRHLVSKPLDRVSPGDVIVFRLRPGLAAKHLGIVVGQNSFVHAMEGGPACEVALASWWQRRIAAAFSFPGIID